MFNESLKSLGLMFEHALSKGVKVVNVKDLAKAQIAFGKLGEHWQGERGAAKIAQMDASIAGASFGSRQGQLINMVLAQNWKELAKGTEFEKTGYNLADAYLLKEEIGAKPELMQKLSELIKALTGNDRLAQLHTTKKTLNLANFSDANDILSNDFIGSIPSPVSEAALASAKDDEQKQQDLQNASIEHMAKAGVDALGLKNSLEDKMLGALEGLKETLEGIDKGLNALKSIPDAINEGFAKFQNALKEALGPR